jgi:hypothetical protein
MALRGRSERDMGQVSWRQKVSWMVVSVVRRRVRRARVSMVATERGYGERCEGNDGILHTEGR